MECTIETATYTASHTPLSCTRALVLRRSSTCTVSSVRLLTRFSQYRAKLPRPLSFSPCCSAHSVPAEERKQQMNESISSPEFRKFKEAAQKGNLVPLLRQIFSDHLTPVSAYRCLVKEGDCEAPSFLLESIGKTETGNNNEGRYSILGVQPALEVIAKDSQVTILNHEKGSVVKQETEDPFKIPTQITAKWTPVVDEALPDMFCGGWVGFFSYDMVRYAEKKKLPRELAPTDDRHLPDIHLGLYKEVVVFDHVAKIIYVSHWVCIDEHSSLEEAYVAGQRQLDAVVTQLQSKDLSHLSQACTYSSIANDGSAFKGIPSMTKDEYIAAINKAKEHILAGDIFQIVLSRRFERRTYADPFEVYRALRIVNPSLNMVYLQTRACILVASSPETFTRVKKGKITNRPLGGTRWRGKSQEEDLMLEKELLSNEKECAEHIMLVDLGRNDVGKVSKAGSVKVEKLMEVIRYSHVMHMSSTVTGELLDGLTSWDALRAALPVGTVNGAPKVRAMELIDELERTRRGPYSGGIGYVSFTDDMDLTLALRTLVFPTDAWHHHNTTDTRGGGEATGRREWVVHLQSGAGIVADSNPEDEYQESLNKLAGPRCAIDLAETAFVPMSAAVNGISQK